MLLWLGQIALTGYTVVLTLLCVYGLHRLFLVWTFIRVRRRALCAPRRFSDLPTVTVQLPMFNEQSVARRVIEAAAALDYPREKLEIQVLDDSTDDSAEIVRHTVQRLRAAGHNISVLHRTDRTGYKAGALEAGARQAGGEFLAIFDADFVPRRAILREAIHHFTDPQVGMVQCRWDHLNRGDSVLTAAQAVLLDGHFLIEHTARNRTGRYMSFNGTAGIWRKQAIVQAGGWSHDTLTEDLDLSYRAQLAGWRFVFLPEITAPAELPPVMSAFKAQQHRWTKGGAQTCRKLLPAVLRSQAGWPIKLEAWFHLSSCAVYVLMVLLTLLIGPALLTKLYLDENYNVAQMAVDMLLLVFGTGSALAFYIASQLQIRRPWWEIVRNIPALMAIGIGIALNNALAALEGFVSRAGEFVRTPKYGGTEKHRGDDHKHPRIPCRLPRGAWKAWLELGLAAYLLACLAAFLFFDNWVQRVSAAVPFLSLFIFGYAYVAITTLTGYRAHSRDRAPDALKPAAAH